MKKYALILLAALICLIPCGTSLADDTDYIKCAVDGLNMREGPGTEYAVTGRLSRGDFAAVMEQGDGWTRVRRVPDGKTGWVCAEYVTSADATDVPEYLDVTTLEHYSDAIGHAVVRENCRAFDAPGGSALDLRFESGDRLDVLFMNEGYSYVSLDGAEGWVKSKKLSTAFVSGMDFGDGFSYGEMTDEIKEYTKGLSYKDYCTVPYDELRCLYVKYVDFEGGEHEGRIIVNVAVAKEMLIIMRELYSRNYAFTEISLVDKYDADDRASMTANNTSAFNYRTFSSGSTLSMHAFGLAIDINPLINPYVSGDYFSPFNAGEYVDRSRDFPGKIDKNDISYALFTGFGWGWGGSWRTSHDYQHFEKDAYGIR